MKVVKLIKRCVSSAKRATKLSIQAIYSKTICKPLSFLIRVKGIFGKFYIKLTRIPFIGKVFNLPIIAYDVITFRMASLPLFPNIADLSAYLIKLRQENIKYKGLALVGSLALCLVLIFQYELPILSSGQYVAKIKIHGKIDHKTHCSKEFQDMIDRIIKDKKVAAVIVDINSPGGEVFAAESLYNNLRRISEKKPTVAVVSSLAASAAYQAAVACDKIFAGGSSIVGSIGVLTTNIEYTRIAEKLGIKLEIFKSTPEKASPNPYQQTTKEVEELLKNRLEDIYLYFKQIVQERRKLTNEELEAVSNGTVFTGRQGLKNKLIDSIGCDRDAMDSWKQFGMIGKNTTIKEVNPQKKNSNIPTKSIYANILQYVGIQLNSVVEEALDINKNTMDSGFKMEYTGL